MVLPLNVVADCNAACRVPQNSVARYLSVSHCCQNDAIYHRLPPSTTNGREISSKPLKEGPLKTEFNLRHSHVLPCYVTQNDGVGVRMARQMSLSPSSHMFCGRGER